MYSRQQAEKLHQMIKDGDHAAVEQLLASQGDRAKDLCVFEVPRDGTAMHVAARTGNCHLLRHFISLGACVNARIIEGHVVAGFRPLHAAAKYGQLEMVKLLLDSGAEIDAQEADGQTALHVACLHSKTDVVEYLAEQGADINMPDNVSQYPLHSSILRGPVDISQILVDHGANVHVDDKDGQSVLHYAAEWDNCELVELFISNGCNPNGQDKEGRTPLHVTTSDDVFKLLLRFGADPNIRDLRGKPPRDGQIDVKKPEYQNINKALSRNYEEAGKRNIGAASALRERSPRVFSPGPPLPETELKVAKTNMLQELQRQVPRQGSLNKDDNSQQTESLRTQLATTALH